MLKIDKHQNITLTRGDSLTLTIQLSKDGATYTPVSGDAIRFAMAKGYVTDPGYQLITIKTIPTDTLTFTVSSSETKVPLGTYNYDVQITHSGGLVDTVISAQIKIVGEVE